MRWGDGRRSENVEDRRGSSPGPGIGLPGRRSLGIPIGGGIGGVGVVIVVLVMMFLGVDPSVILQPDVVEERGTEEKTAPPPETGRFASDEQTLADFVSVVLASTEDTWQAVFRQELRRDYAPPVLVLFSRAVRSACGFAQAAAGPFYCPSDRRVYLDLSFFGDLRRRFGAPGDFAQAYVVAHEVGHHVQTLLGTSRKVQAARGQVSQTEFNALSVRLELQADCLAGVWARHADRVKGIVEAGDIEEALNAATAIGDDRLQKQGQGYVVPESFTHGSSEQRVRWFKRGLEEGTISGCDTFATDRV